MSSPDMLRLPQLVRANAWTGEPEGAQGRLGPDALGWALAKQGEALPEMLAPAAPADLRNWRDPRVGWGLVLPDDDSLDEEAKARGEDAPAPLRALLDSRVGCPVLRYRAKQRFTSLRRYYLDRPAHDIGLSASARGVGTGALPRYLLLYGGPEVIPWSFQYVASQACAVGRLTLTGAALERYVTSLISEWSDASAEVTNTVVWAVDHGPDDISNLMRRTIAVPLQQRLVDDSEIGDRAVYLDGSDGGATAAGLYEALARGHPGLVVTTSHGKTGPLADPMTMQADLGLPVDGELNTVRPDLLLDAWEPDGAIWYAHACCSAGSDATTIYRGLLDPGSPIDLLLEGIARLGNHVAPLPTALLGAEKPLRAFVGHVEPTFDWTIRNPQTGQPLMTSVVDALYDRLFQPDPLGFALREPYAHVGELYTQRDAAYRAFDEGEDTQGVALATQLAARDRQSMVVLGDPTVALPPLPSRRG
jgi:hypothetical protein